VALAVLSVYPEHHWKLWKFRRIPKDWWANMQNQLLFLDSVKEELQLREMSDWYKVSNSTLYKLGGMLNITPLIFLYPVLRTTGT